MTQYPLADGRRIRVVIDGSNLLAVAQVLTVDGSDGYNILGLNPYSRSVNTAGVTSVSNIIVLISLLYFLEQSKW